MESPRTTAQDLIPGAYDRSNLTHRQPGAMGGAANGTSGLPAGPSSMDAATIAEHGKEGGHVDARRWERWQRGSAKSNRKTMTRARVAFAIILIAVAAWVGLQVMLAA